MREQVLLVCEPLEAVVALEVSVVVNGVVVEHVLGFVRREVGGERVALFRGLLHLVLLAVQLWRRRVTCGCALAFLAAPVKLPRAAVVLFGRVVRGGRRWRGIGAAALIPRVVLFLFSSV